METGGDEGEEAVGQHDDLLVGMHPNDADHKKFIVTDGEHDGPASFHATGKDIASSASTLRATAVRIPGGDRYWKVVRCYHDIPTGLQVRL